MHIFHTPVVLVDIETTDILLENVEGHFAPQIIQLAALALDEGFDPLCDRGVFDVDIRPKFPGFVSPFIETLTGISESSRRLCHTWDTHCKDFWKYTSESRLPLMSWSSPFDKLVLERAYRDLGTKNPHSPKFFCAMSYARCMANVVGLNPKGDSLKAFCEALDIEPEESHTALSGVTKMWEVLTNLQALIKE